MKTMRTLPLALLFLTMACVSASAQKITAPDGFYPPAYSGDAWVGRVTKVDDQARTLTLVSIDKRKKEQTFVGVIEKGYLVKHKSGRIVPLKASEVPLGLKVTAFYEEKTKKVHGKKIHYNLIFDMNPLWNRKTEYKLFQAF